MNYGEKTVADIVSENYKTADVFKKHKIDFCCSGNISIEEACAKRNISSEIVIEELNNLELNNSMHQNISHWNLDFLCNYIVNNHHNYIRNNLSLLKQYAKKVASVHGKEHPELIKLRNTVFALLKELQPHLEKEEEILFKYINEMVETKRTNGIYEKPMFMTIANPIAAMHHEHDNAGDLIKEINELTNNFTLPENACKTYTVYFAKLKEFQDDLFQHIHLENNILFPKAIKFEKELVDGMGTKILNVIN